MAKMGNYLDSSTEESDVDKDVGSGDYLDYSYECRNTFIDNKSKGGTLSTKILHALKRQ